MNPVPVIDLFAGPGGLGEGFSSLFEGNKPYFKIVLSIEKEPNAHSTLELRSFFRQFGHKEVPEDYYRFLRQEISRDELFHNYPEQAVKAQSEAKLATLGGTDATQVDEWIHEALHGDRREWVLIGGPPCQAYSLAGRSRNKGKIGYEPAKDTRHYLYKEYLRIITQHWPSVFVMENVKGLLSSRIDGQRLFDKIYEDLENPGRATESEERYRYRIYSLVESSNPILGANNVFTIKSENYGIPQARHRVILLGVRDSIEFENLTPETLQPEGGCVTAWDVIADLPKIRSGLSSQSNGISWIETINELKQSRWFHDLDDQEKKKIDESLAKLNKTVKSIPELGAIYMRSATNTPSKLRDWYVDEKLKGDSFGIELSKVNGIESEKSLVIH